MNSRRYLLALALLSVAGCAEHIPPPLPTEANHVLSRAQADVSAHQQLLQSLARALQNESVRAALHHALNQSPVAEGKLHFVSYLSAPGSPLLPEMARARGVTQQRLLQMVSEVRPLELYLPVPRHRQVWTGGDELIVAGALHEEDAPVGFALNGGIVTLARSVPPETPVLALVPVESFDGRGQPYPWSGRRPSPPSSPGSKSRRQTDPGSGLQTQEETCDPATAIQPCEGDGGGGGGGWSPPSNAVFTRGIGVREVAAFLRTYNDHEPWFKGAPEYRLIIVGTSNLDSNAELRNVIVVPEGG